MSAAIEIGLHAPILQSLPQPVLVCAQDKSIVFANYAAEAFFHASSSILTRQKLSDFIAFGSPILSLIENVAGRQAPMIEYRVAVGGVGRCSSQAAANA